MGRDMRPRFAHGLFFDDFQEGDEFSSAGRTITEAAFDIFSGVTGDYSDVHTDAQAMSATEFGRPIGHAILSLGVMQGLMWQSGYVRNTAMATLAWTDLRWPRPVFAGDTVTAQWTIVAARPSGSRPHAGVITEACVLTNQRGEQVLTGSHVLMVKRRAEQP